MTEPCKITPAAPVPPAALLAIQPHPDAPEPCPLDHSCEEGEQCGCWCELHDCPIANCPSYKLVTAWLDDARRAGVAAGRTAAAADIAYKIRAELVCCDIYDKDAYTDRAGRTHGICFWGEAGARIAETIDAEPEPTRIAEGTDHAG